MASPPRLSTIKHAGYAYAFAVGLAHARLDPAVPATGAYFIPGYWGGYPCCGTTATNVYRRPNGASVGNVRSGNVNSAGPVQMTDAAPQTSAATTRTRRAATTGRPTSRRGATARPAPSKQWQPYTLPNVYYADPDGNVYRQDDGTLAAEFRRLVGQRIRATPRGPTRRRSAQQQQHAGRGGQLRHEQHRSLHRRAEHRLDRAGRGQRRLQPNAAAATAASAREYYNYWNDVQNNASVMWWDGPYGGTNLWYSGIGWSSRFP